MRYLLIGITLLAAACGNQSGKEQAKIDTARLFDPYPDTLKDGRRPNVPLVNYVAVGFEGAVAVKCNQNEVFLKEIDGVADFIKKHADTIKQKKFFIIIDTSVSFQKTVSVIDILKKNKIENYRVYNWNEHDTWQMNIK